MNSIIWSKGWGLILGVSKKLGVENHSSEFALQIQFERSEFAVFSLLRMSESVSLKISLKGIEPEASQDTPLAPGNV